MSGTTEPGSYFVANYPPFARWHAGAVPEVLAAFAAEPAGEPLGLYVHIPFCRKRCKFCYFRVYTDTSAADVERYSLALAREAGIAAAGGITAATGAGITGAGAMTDAVGAGATGTGSGGGRAGVGTGAVGTAGAAASSSSWLLTLAGHCRPSSWLARFWPRPASSCLPLLLPHAPPHARASSSGSLETGVVALARNQTNFEARACRAFRRRRG
jgi:hypothetical protein